MLAIEDIKNPERLRVQSQAVRAPPSSSSQAAALQSPLSVASTGRQRWELPEEYSDDFINRIIGDASTIYGLATFVFKGTSSGMSADQRNRNQVESRKSSRIAIEKTTNDAAFYARWIFERFQEETGFKPFEERGIRTLDIEATREALKPVQVALQSHYQYAV
ncbi:hypothetical protein BGZ83_005332, partial [Gryganskiella cystojenkinii]